MPRHARRTARRALRRCEQAVSEVVGYILMFFLSSAILLLSLQAFLTSRDASTNLQAANELRLVANRVAQEVQQAGVVAAQLPNSTYEVTIPLPTLSGIPYYVEANHSKVWANTTDGKIVANADAFQVEQLGLTLSGKVYGSQGYAKVRYNVTAGAKAITLLI
jgi:hypothetical protein